MKQSRTFAIRNRLHDIPAVNMGSDVEPVLDVIFGISSPEAEFAVEYQKVVTAVELGIKIVTDVSTVLDDTLRRRVLAELPIAYRTVPTYEIYQKIKAGRSSPRSAVLEVVESHVSAGVDCITVHASGAPWRANHCPDFDERLIPITSRGGAMMQEIAAERAGCNPYLESFDDLLDICADYGVTLSLATTARPGSVADALSRAHLAEMNRQAELVSRAHAREVNVVVEVLGHVPLDLIPTYCEAARREFDGAPFGALGPCTTDVAMTHDDVAGAIGAAVAAMHGTSFIACITAGEHCHLPTVDEVASAIKAFQVAVHSGWIARTGLLDRDIAMSKARNSNDWRAMADNALHSEDARRVISANGYHSGQVCTMCGGSCPIVRTNALFRSDLGEYAAGPLAWSEDDTGMPCRNH
ncbi:phosphomethylpyrimidine synthase ThiC [Mycolicibacterium peregrinum]|uniref:phosphomethylpyrimidine synthase ThiC n=1 Tax=Mycolicibacterium peregrinum TaxID=43304 RepID=UPI003AB029CE